MAKTRIPIPNDLVAKVIFDSDRTCCVCRDQNRKTEIHHIDDDPSNNDFSNLAVVCKDHHSEAHTNYAFARNLTADVIRIYNKSWREIVRARLSPVGDKTQLIEYEQQVLLEISLAPHIWKGHYMCLHPEPFRFTGPSSAEPGRDIWDMMAEIAEHRYSHNEWKKYHSLFDAAITTVTERLQDLVVAHGDVVPVPIKLAVLRTTSQLVFERSVYLQIPQLIIISPGGEDSTFHGRFLAVTKILAALARAVDQQRSELAPGG